MGISIVIKDVGYRESAHLQSQPRDVHLFGKLHFVGIQLLLLASEPPDLPEKDPGDIDVAAKLARLVGLSIWKRSQAMRLSEAEPLVILEIEINFSAWPNAAS